MVVARSVTLSVVVSLVVLLVACHSAAAPSSGSPSPKLSAGPAATSAPTAVSARPSVAASVRPSPQRPVVGVGEPWIAFQRNIGVPRIALMRPDGTDLHWPTDGAPRGDQTNPDWSPDGRQLVFGVNVGGRDDLWIVGADRSGARELLPCDEPCIWLDDPAWSPDGRAVLFSRVREVDGAAVGTLERVDVASGAVSLIVEAAPTGFYAGPRWSPDGRFVVAEVIRREGTTVDSEVAGVTLTVIDVADPSSVVALTDPAVFGETAAWARGGDIVYAALPAPGAPATDLFVVRPDGSGTRRLTELAAAGGRATHPDVSPDGTIVMFVAQRTAGGPEALAIVDLAGGAVTSATGREPAVEGTHPRFRPTP